MRISVKNIYGKGVGHIEVKDDVFNAPPNSALVLQVLVGQRANARQGTADTKTRAQVSGGGRKPHPQKGTGRARAGSNTSPIWRGGGVIFGPHPRSYRQRTPKRMRRMSTVSVISNKLRDGELIVVDGFIDDQSKTKDLVSVLDGLIRSRTSTLIVADDNEGGFVRSARNIPKTKTLPATLINTLDLVNHRNVVMTVNAVRKFEELFGGVRRRKHNKAGTAA